MKKSSFLLIVSGLLFVVLLSMPACDPDKDDLKAMNGTWKIEKAIYMGNDSSDIFSSGAA